MPFRNEDFHMAQHSLRRKLAFASADFFGGGSFNIVNFLYPEFLALTVGVSPFWISFIFLVARVWDAVTDPIMGYISDHTHSKLGKRRIYLLISAPLVVVGMYLLFFPFNFPNEWTNVIAVLMSYLVFTTIQTSIMIPYYSLSSEISSNFQERASYNSYRLGFSIFASILCVAVPGIMVEQFADARIGYQVMSLTFGVLFGLSVLMTGLFAKEEITTPTVSTQLSIKEMAKPLKLRPFRQYLGMFLVLQLSMAVMSGLFFFYVDFYVTKDATAAGQELMVADIAAALMFVTQIFALPVYLKMIQNKGKTFAYRFGAIIWIASALLLLVIPPNINPVFIYGLAVVMGFGISGPGLVPHTMYGDVVDAGQLLFKDRLDGQMSGFTNFINKMAQALGLAAVMFIIGLAGFQSQDLTQPDILSQPDSAMLAIRIIMAVVPLIFMGIGIFISRHYRIDSRKQAEIAEAIRNPASRSEEIIAGL